MVLRHIEWRRRSGGVRLRIELNPSIESLLEVLAKSRSGNVRPRFIAEQIGDKPSIEGSLVEVFNDTCFEDLLIAVGGSSRRFSKSHARVSSIGRRSKA